MSPKRRIGVFAITLTDPSVRLPSSFRRAARFCLPIKNPGASALTRIFSLYFIAISAASQRVKFDTPSFATPYPATRESASYAAIEEIFHMQRTEERRV